MNEKRGGQMSSPTSVDLVKQYEDLMTHTGTKVTFTLGFRRMSLWAAIIPQVVPSVATYGAYEEPLLGLPEKAADAELG